MKYYKRIEIGLPRKSRKQDHIQFSIVYALKGANKLQHVPVAPSGFVLSISNYQHNNRAISKKIEHVTIGGTS